MRSSKLDECFDGLEEKEFLAELVEAALIEASAALASHVDDSHCVGTPAEIDDYLENLGRQQRKIKFLEMLQDCLEEGG